MGTKVHEVMTARPRSISPETSVSQAAELMQTEDIGAIPILEGEQLAGMITDRDIVVRAIAEGKDPRGMPVREISTRDVVAVGPNADLSEALELMASNQIRRLPVVDDDNRLVGVVAQADVAIHVKDKKVGEVVEDISTPPQGPRPH